MGGDPRVLEDGMEKWIDQFIFVIQVRFWVYACSRSSVKRLRHHDARLRLWCLRVFSTLGAGANAR